MDPDANFAEQIELALWLENNDANYGPDGRDTNTDWIEKAERLSLLVLALNDWIANGGFAPKKFRGPAYTVHPGG